MDTTSTLRQDRNNSQKTEQVKPELPLREYQTQCIQEIIQQHKNGIHRQMVSLPTGSGKTVIFANLIKQLNKPALVLAHTRELLQQAKQKIEIICPDLGVGIVDQYHKEFNKWVVVSTVQSAMRQNNLKWLLECNFGLVIVDEAHRSAAMSYRETLEALGFGKDTKRLLVGFTATAFRDNAKHGLKEVFDKVVFERGIKWMIEHDFLVTPTGYKIPTDIDLSDVPTVDNDYKQASLADVMNTEAMNDLVVDTYRENSAGRKAICFAVTVQHAKALAKVFNKAKISAAYVFGDMPREERDRILEDYRSGKIQVLCNCQVLTEGFDDPQTDCIIVARPTKSRGLFVQMVGRGLRKYPNKKDAHVLDFGSKHHDLITVASLLEDQDFGQTRERRSSAGKIPEELHPSLKRALVKASLLGEGFCWTKEFAIWMIKGIENSRIEVQEHEFDDTYGVMFIKEDHNGRLDGFYIAKRLPFEYAFAAAEDYANKHKQLFVLSDKSAEWRERPVSDKQLDVLKSKYKSKAVGIEKLTKGQASLLIANGGKKRKHWRKN